MKILALFLLFPLAAFADHSLGEVMRDSPDVKKAVEKAIKKVGMICDVDHSLQMAPPSEREIKVPTKWRQIAFCYKNTKSRDHDSGVLSKGNEFGGIYGLEASTVLDVTYTWGAYGSNERLIEISIK